MGLYLAAFSWTNVWMGYAWAIVALGLVIFVHELGHFLVAKACGVKCEKFYLGFDIGGIKLLKFRWGETEYGIGILPLGGYVKMLGQEDNPARLREEMERARVSTGDGDPPAEDASVEEAAVSSTLTTPTYDPRSYLAKSVPARMAIISAGVIMNMIFAFLIAVLAYAIGVKHIACGIGEVVPGEAAWKADLRTGDEILKINGQPVTRFMEVRTKISLGNNLDKGVQIEVARPGVAKPISVNVVPIQRGLPSIGILSPRTTTLNSEGKPAFPGTPAALATPALASGDRIVEIDGRPIANSSDMEKAEALNADKVMKVTVERSTGRDKPAERIAVAVPPRPMRTLGLVMNLGEITAIQANSPAAKAGLQPGDQIMLIDGQDPGDPLTLPDRLPPAGDVATLTVTRKGAKDPLKIDVALRQDDRIETPLLPKSPISAPAMGIAYRVLNRVRAVEEGSPADKAGVRLGDVVTGVALYPPAELPEGIERKPNVFKVRFSDEERNWPFFFYQMQDALAGSTLKLTLESGRTVDLEPVAAKDWFNTDRGFVLEPKLVNQRAHGLGDALRLGWDETWEATTLVFGVLGKLGTQISPRELSGPWGILQAASRAAQEGITRLLLFLCMISANLAVINFLPIPLLDGGHMVFLAYEGIRGKPASERVQLVLTYMGLIFLLALMAWVVGLDFNLISRE